jgi:hypothetical protein
MAVRQFAAAAQRSAQFQRGASTIRHADPPPEFRRAADIVESQSELSDRKREGGGGIKNMLSNRFALPFRST